MNTPITISSTSTVPNKSDFLQLNYTPGNNEQSVISLGSTSFERVPVSWASKNNFKQSDSNTTLSNIQKVSNWIRSIEEPKNDSFIMDLDDDSKDSSSSKGEQANTENIREDASSDSKSVILFRCDFNKSVPTKVYRPLMSPLHHIMNEINDTISGSIASKSSKSEPIEKRHIASIGNNRILQKNLLKHPETDKFVNNYSKHNKVSVEKESVRVNESKPNGSSEAYEVPLSPESRKKELCSYLQLMNPADKKERFILQNRRSTRVRNLTALQEKRKMDDKISESSESERLTKEMEKCPTLKSFKELNIRVEKTKLGDELWKEKACESDADIFYFPFPSKELTENVQDFDNTMSKFISRYKRICRIKNLKLNSKVGLTKSVPKKKENLVNSVHKVKSKIDHKNNNVKNKGNIVNKNNLENSQKSKLKELLKKKYKSPLKAARTNSLRSTGKFKNISLKKLIGYKEKELNRKTIKKPMREQRKSKEAEPQPKKKSQPKSSEIISKVKSVSPQCEIVTVPKTSDENYIDIENLMDDVIDFSNLSEEHKKCLIENRILSTKQAPVVAAPSNTEEELSKSLYSLEEISPLYGFDETDKVKIMCESYKNPVLNSDKGDKMEEDLVTTDEIKVEENNMRENTEHKTDMENATEKLKPADESKVLELEFVDVDNNKWGIENDESDDKSTSNKHRLLNGITLQEHDYAGLPSDDEIEEETENDSVTVSSQHLLVRNCVGINPRSLGKQKFEVLPYNKSVEMKSLHKSLQYAKRSNNSSLSDTSFAREWDADNSSKQKSKKQSHFISINKQNGAVLKAFYIDFNLIVCQENIVSFWMQTPLGNVLGSQNMWIPRGHIQRLVLNGKCMQKESMEMVIATETHVAYIELWAKEHKSDIREGPVADVFATVYFWKQRQNGLDKKVLQLENINGFADDVQYSVMKTAPKIIVSWHSAHDDCAAKQTFIHAYELAADYQTVANIYNIEPVDHYVSSLHNIEDCDSLIMGCGENKITLWNVEYGYIIATIALSEIKSPLSTLWVKCDRGFLFALQQCVDRELRLIAINGINHSWKKLASYIPPEGFDRLRGVCIENGLLLSFYDQGILCWKAETGEPIEETNVESDIIPSGKYVILIEDDQILVKHAMTHLMSLCIEET